MSHLEVKLLGGFSVVYAEQPVDELNVKRFQSLLTYLFVYRHLPQPRQQIAAHLWPETSEKQARTNLRNLIFQIKNAFPPIESYIQMDRKTLQWQSDLPYSLDIAELEMLLQEDALPMVVEGMPSPTTNVRPQTESNARLANLRSAIDLYRGDLVPALYDDWALFERERYRSLYVGALQDLCAELEASRHYGEAIGIAEKLLLTDPLQESSYRLLMRLHAFNDDRSAALNVYQTCETVLRQELDVEPSPKTAALKESLLQPEATLDMRGGSQLPRAVAEQSVSPVAESIGSTSTGLAQLQNHLVGRQAEWTLLQKAWSLTEDGYSHCVILQGEAGIGKTRLAEEMMTWVRRQGRPAAISHCYTAQQAIPYSPVVRWLRSEALQPAVRGVDGEWQIEAARLLPELSNQDNQLETASPIYESWQRRHLFDGLIQIVCGIQQPLLLVLDDLQWADVESLEWLLTLLRESQSATIGGSKPTPFLLLATLRTEQADSTPFLRSWTSDLNRNGLLTKMDLGPLTNEETLTLGAQVAEKPLNVEEGIKLFGQTEGHPLYIIESVRAGLLHGPHMHLDYPGTLLGNADEALSQTSMMKSVIETRLNQLSDEARTIVNFAAVVGREFSYDILAEASGVDEEVLVDGLDEALARGIIREQQSDTYDFSHGKLRQALYDGLSNARRRLYHKKLASVLEAFSTSLSGDVVGQLALHYELGGQPQEAIGAYLQAAGAAQSIYANQEALSTYQHLLSSELAKQLSNETRCKILSTAGKLWYTLGQWQDANSHYNELLILTEAEESSRYRASAHLGLAQVLWRQGMHDEALTGLEIAETHFEICDDLVGIADVLETQGDIYWYLNNLESAEQVHERQSCIGEQIGSAPIQCRSQYALGRILWLGGKADEAIKLVQNAYLHADAHDLIAEKGRLAHLNASIFGTMGNHEALWTWDMEALTYAEQMGDQELINRCIMNLMTACAEFGDFDGFRRCVLYSLSGSIKIRDLPNVGMTTANFGYGCLLHGEYKLAESLLERSHQIMTRYSDMPQNNLTVIDSLSLLYLETERYEELDTLAEEFPEILSESGQPSLNQVQYKITYHVRDAKVQLADGVSPKQALATLETMLADAETASEPEQDFVADLHYQIWRLAPDYERHGQAAADIYLMLSEKRPRYQFRKRYQQLTGIQLPEPLPLTLPKLLADQAVDLDQVLAQLDDWLSELEPSQDS